MTCQNPECGKEFLVRVTNQFGPQKYCSNTCNQRACYLRHKAEYMAATAARKNTPAGKAWIEQYKQRCKADGRQQRWSQKSRLKKLGLTIEWFEAECARRKNKCDSCGKVKPLVPDHDHKTGQVRGLLCGFCNRGIGLFYDSPHLLFRAAYYLKTRDYLT